MKMMMMWMGLVLLSITAALADSASPDQIKQKVCILNSAAKLPPIPGLEIVSSRILGPTHDGFGWRAEIDVKAAGQSATFNFTCDSGVSVLEGVSK